MVELVLCLNQLKKLLSKKAIERYKDKTNHPMFGKIASEETKEKMRESALNKPQPSIDSRKRMSVTRTGKKYSPEHCANISKGNLGKKKPPWNPETKITRSALRKGIPRGQYKVSICPFCNKEGSGGNMKRYHFDNCKCKP